MNLLISSLETFDLLFHMWIYQSRIRYNISYVYYIIHFFYLYIHDPCFPRFWLLWLFDPFVLHFVLTQIMMGCSTVDHFFSAIILFRYDYTSVSRWIYSYLHWRRLIISFTCEFIRVVYVLLSRICIISSISCIYMGMILFCFPRFWLLWLFDPFVFYFCFPSDHDVGFDFDHLLSVFIIFSIWLYLDVYRRWACSYLIWRRFTFAFTCEFIRVIYVLLSCPVISCLFFVIIYDREFL